MIILDTSVWIEFLKKNPDYFPIIASFLETRQVLAVECVFGELLQGVKNAREQTIILGYWQHLPKIPASQANQLIIDAGIYSSRHRLIDKGVGLIDAVILMHGMRSEAKIWTLDGKLLKVLPKELVYAGIASRETS